MIIRRKKLNLVLGSNIENNSFDINQGWGEYRGGRARLRNIKYRPVVR